LSPSKEERRRREDTRLTITTDEKSSSKSSSSSTSSKSSRGQSAHSRSGSISISRGPAGTSVEVNRDVELIKKQTDMASPIFDGDPNVIEIE
jgi:hypothetical protein